MRNLFIAPLFATALSFTAPLVVQADDRSYLTALLEDNLSGAGRKVTVTGFAGALSSRATIQQLTIADDQGIWITLDDVVLDWSRTALLSGEVIINELSASTITLARLPDQGEEELTPEAQPFTFALPELPVSVDIGEIRADQVVLGESVLGQALQGTLSAKMHLANGEGSGTLLIERQDDGPDGKIGLQASFVNETGLLILNLDAAEGADGIFANLLDLPGTPAAGLSLQGQGRLDDFAATFRLESDGEARLSGPITVKRSDSGQTDFAARLAGNPAPLFLPGYADFLGTALKLNVSGSSLPDGALQLQTIELASKALNLSGRVNLAADHLPALIDITAALRAPDGTQVLLPLSGPNETRVTSAVIALKFDAAAASDWTAEVDLKGLDRPEMTVASASLRGAGHIDRLGDKRGVRGTLKFALNGLGQLDAALLTALGTDFNGETEFRWREGDMGFALPKLSLIGSDYALDGRARVKGLDTGLTTDLDLTLTAADLTRFSALAGRPLAGSAVAKLKGSAAPLSGAFDLELDVVGQGLKAGIAEVDRLLAGQSLVKASVLRDTEGLTLRSFSADAASLHATGQGMLASTGADLTGAVTFGNLADLGGRYGGALALTGAFNGSAENGSIKVSGKGNDLRVGQAEVDRVITGASDLSAELALINGAPVLRALTLTAPNLSAAVTGEGDQGAMRVSGKLRDLALLASDFPGPVTLSGRLEPQGDAFNADLRVQGPAGIDAKVTGLIGATPNITVTGRGEAAVINAFVDPVGVAGTLNYDMRLQGGWALKNASGRVTLAGGRVALPTRGIGLEGVAVSVDLADGAARIAATATASRGGKVRVDGRVSLAAPFDGALDLTLSGVILRDPELFDTSFDAALTLTGPLTGAARLAGTVTLGDTELRVPSTGFASAAELDKIRHIKDSAAVKATRAKAGVGNAGSDGDPQSSSASGGLNWLIDVLIRAPNRVFVRGRGLDAELGGEIRLGGSLNNIVPVGALDLIRGRLDILGQRLELSAASLVLEGDFNPYVNFSASNQSGDVTSIVSITGPANDPEVLFSSQPELPQEEVLAWLLFGRGLDNISAFQAAQLANAVATLAGRGGEGLVNKLRRGFGFDDLDVNTADDGSTSVKAGKYISDNVYTEIGVDGTGNTRINLNLDLRPGVTVKGRVDTDSSSGIGIFLEKDY